jgi:hypothetical protein
MPRPSSTPPTISSKTSPAPWVPRQVDRASLPAPAARPAGASCGEEGVFKPKCAAAIKKPVRHKAKRVFMTCGLLSVRGAVSVK